MPGGAHVQPHIDHAFSFHPIGSPIIGGACHSAINTRTPSSLWSPTLLSSPRALGAAGRPGIVMTPRGCSAMAPVSPLLLLLVAAATVLAPAAAELPRLEHSPKADGSLTILAVGDWGRRGTFNQSQVATQVYVVMYCIVHITLSQPFSATPLSRLLIGA